MGTNECSQPASKSSWDSQDFGDVNMVLKMGHFQKYSRPQWGKERCPMNSYLYKPSQCCSQINTLNAYCLFMYGIIHG